MGDLCTIILAGGYGTRLGELGRRTAKPLLKMGDGCLLDYVVDKVCQIDNLSSSIILVNSQFLSQYQQWIVGNEHAARLNLVNNQRPDEEVSPDIITNIALTLERKRITADLLIVGGDNLFDFSLRDFVIFARQHGISTVVMDVGSPSEAESFSVVTLGRDGRIVQLLEKPKAPRSTLVTTCIYWFPAAALKLFSEYAGGGAIAKSFGQFMQWLVGKEPMYGFLAEGKWYDVGTLDTYHAVRSEFGTPFPLKGSRVLFQKPLEAPKEVRRAFEVLKGRLQVQDALPEKPDAVVVCGSDLLHVADEAAHVYHNYVAKGQRLHFVITGGHGKLTPPHWSTEADAFGARMAELGVLPSQIILETKADTMTSNLRNGKRELELKQLHVSSLLVIADDAQLRRAVLTAQKEFPGVQIAGHAPGHFDLDRAPEEWSVEEWRQRLLWTEVNELGRLVKYQIENTAEFAPVAVSKDQLQAAICIGDHLTEDQSIPQKARRYLLIWLSALHAALDLPGAPAT
jgi:glucose-1-phosphate thymidylyltransferase